jgi:hypothetical protein
MTTFKEANQARLKLKNKMAGYSWYSNSGVFLDNDRYYIGLTVKRLDDSVKHIVPSYVDGVLVKTILE